MGLLNPSRESKFSDANADREIIIFSVQLTTCRIGNLTRLIHTLFICVTIHTYGRQNKNHNLRRIDLTISALAGVRGYLQHHSDDELTLSGELYDLHYIGVCTVVSCSLLSTFAIVVVELYIIQYIIIVLSIQHLFYEAPPLNHPPSINTTFNNHLTQKTTVRSKQTYL